MTLSKLDRRKRIKNRIRKIIKGTPEKPRLSVFRSNRQISVQLIDDINGKTLLSVSSLLKEIAEKKGNKIQQAGEVGKMLAEKAKEQGITDIYFDRSGYLYHGRIKVLAESARKAGLKF